MVWWAASNPTLKGREKLREFRDLRAPARAWIEGIAQPLAAAFVDLLLEADQTVLDRLSVVSVLQETVLQETFLAVCREQMGRFHEQEARLEY